MKWVHCGESKTQEDTCAAATTQHRRSPLNTHTHTSLCMYVSACIYSIYVFIIPPTDNWVNVTQKKHYAAWYTIYTQATAQSSFITSVLKGRKIVCIVCSAHVCVAYGRFVLCHFNESLKNRFFTSVPIVMSAGFVEVCIAVGWCVLCVYVFIIVELHSHKSPHFVTRFWCFTPHLSRVVSTKTQGVWQHCVWWVDSDFDL